MKKLSIRQEFEHPLQTLLEAREERYKRLDKFPELKNVRVVSETRDGELLKQVREISIADSLPPIIATLLPAGADHLLESSEFDSREHLHTFRVTPGGHDQIFLIKGESRYYSTGDNASGRSYDIDITSKAFLVGPVVENAIAEVYAKNLEKDRRSILHFIELLKEEGRLGASGASASHEAPAQPADPAPPSES